MGHYVAHRICKLLAKAGRPLAAARVGVLGLTFKENVPDVRNSKVFDLIDELHAYGIQPLVHDPVAPSEAFERTSITTADLGAFRALDCVVLAVPHAEFCRLKGPDYDAMLNDGGIFIDIKSQFTNKDFRPGINYWSL